MPSGVVALLDAETSAKVEAIWQEFQDTFGVHGVSVTPIPHFSFHVAEAYDAEQIVPMMKDLAQNIPPFSVRTAGLGIFTGTLPVLHIAVVRNIWLGKAHREIWNSLTPLATGIQTYYHINHWQPHITIAQGDIPPEKFPDVIRMLQDRDFNWNIEVNKLGFIADTSPNKVNALDEVFELSG